MAPSWHSIERVKKIPPTRFCVLDPTTIDINKDDQCKHDTGVVTMLKVLCMLSIQFSQKKSIYGQIFYAEVLKSR